VGLFSEDKPVFIKEDTSATAELDAMRALLPRVSAKDHDRLERDIKLLETGVAGENAVAFELANSHLPIYVLRDLYLENDGLAAQIDFLVIAPYVNVVIECKNLVGDIEVDSRGDFIRTFGTGKYRKREGIYSPITQNERHLQLLRSIKRSQHGAVANALASHLLDNLWKSVVVLANPKTVLNDRYAKKEIKQQIIRADGLIAYIKQLDAEGRKAGNGKASLKDMERSARMWASLHVDRQVDIASRYEIGPEPDVMATSMGSEPSKPVCPRCGAPMIRRVARKGARAGKEFWGCSKYPGCNGIVNIE